MTGDRLLDYITAARWFGGKGRTARLIGVSPLRWLRPPGDWPAVRQEIAEIGYPGTDDHDFYQLLISYRPESQESAGDRLVEITEPGHGVLAGVDGTEDPAAHDALLAFLLDDHGSVPTGEPGLVAHRIGDDPLQTGLPSRLFGGEQSNTSFVYAHLAILKLFRRVEVGRNLDVETHEVLTRAGNIDVARLYGWIEGSWSAPGGGVSYAADLAMITELLPDARDGWEYALAELRAGRQFTDEARRLGRALAEVHDGLRTNFDTATVDGDELVMIMNDRLDAAVRAAPALQPYAPGLRSTFAALGGRKLDAQRVHGDFHLGQTLHTPVGWKIIDFEGEPAKTLAERSRPDSIWRDIAGALRSFDYAAAHRRDDASAGWAAACQAAFLAGYGTDLGAADSADMLSAYVADKAIYEVVYEARNRPDWVQIPLAAVAVIAMRSQHVD